MLETWPNVWAVEFIAEHVTSFEWNDEAFEQLVIPAEHKMVLKTLVDTYNTGLTTKFDDFISGKGLGLVVNLFGNPGTGKSLTAEAMSERECPLFLMLASLIHGLAVQMFAVRPMK